MIFGQLVIGPPGSGKTTYCKAMKEFMEGMGRNAVIINLDPANDILPYECYADVSDLITVDDVMKHKHLGANGGLMYCLEYLEENVDWLVNKIHSLDKTCYILFDCPGQIELYTNHKSVHNIFKIITKDKKVSICVVNLIDSLCCAVPSTFISAVMVSLTAMLRIVLPHINVLSKVDLIERYGNIPFNLDFFTEVQDLNRLLECITEDDPFTEKFKKLSEALIEIINDYSLVSFVPLCIEDKPSMLNLLKHIDKANGYIFGTDKERDIKMLTTSLSLSLHHQTTSVLQDKFVDCTTKEVDTDETKLN